MPSFPIYEKDPNSVEPVHIIWCSLDGTNDGSTDDSGDLQSATISTSTWTAESGLTVDSDNNSSVTIQGVTYSANTISTAVISGGTAETDYTLVNRIVTNESPTRTLDKTVIIRVKSQ